jgi:hypothetical protein
VKFSSAKPLFDWAAGDRKFDSVTRFEQWIAGHTYCRKMMGYLEAIRDGATEIIDTDDDNEPLSPWPSSWEMTCACIDPGWINVYRAFGESRMWPRGLPLTSVENEPHSFRERLAMVGCWQGLAQGDADVDAIYRLTQGAPARFAPYVEPFALAAGTLAPLNSQAITWRRECFPLMYLPRTVGMRISDILRGYVAQPIMWAAGYQVGICGPVVTQRRNQHDLMEDFRDEVPLYLGMAEGVADSVRAVVSEDASMADNLRAAYRELTGAWWIGDELPYVDEWLKELGL